LLVRAIILFVKNALEAGRYFYLKACVIILITFENRVLFAFFGMSDLDHNWLVVGCGGDFSLAIDSDDDSSSLDEDSITPSPIGRK